MKQHESLEIIWPNWYENRQRLSLMSLQHSKEFQGLDQKMQRLIHSLSQGSKFEELKNLIQNENETLREQVNTKFQEHERRQDEREYRTQLLDSLWFAEILSREETIAEAHSETFEWIFDKSGEAVRPWDNFSAWLENGGGIYWINGKAGSGKSTLMSFLCQDKRTIEALTVWSGRKVAFMPNFYFWSSGTTMQRSLEGLLRSLLWQILKESSDTTILPVTYGSLPEQNRGTSLQRGSIGAWTKRRLQRTLQEVISQLQSSCRLCFFIDGLDEFDEDHDELITFVRDIVWKTGVKVCLSSRPYKTFEDAFDASAKLRLQDLTHNGIQQYVNDKFQDVPQLASMTSKNGHEMDELRKDIVDKAEGVFLWVELAVKDQILGLRNEDSPEQLRKRLLRLPSKVEGIYLQMLHGIEQLYREEAARFLQIMLNYPRLSLLGHALESYEDLENMLLSDHNVSTQKITSLCQSTRKKIMTRCAGLLEVHEPLNQSTVSETAGNWRGEPDSRQLNAAPRDDMSASDSKRENVDDSKPQKENELQNMKPENQDRNSGSEIKIIYFEETSVNFVHRTAVDFLKITGPGRKFLEDNLSPDFDPQVFYIKASLGILRLLGPMSHPNKNNTRISLHNIDNIMESVAISEYRSGRPQTRLCELVDGTMTISDRLHSQWRPDSHWSMRWGRLAKFLYQEQARTTLSSRSSSTDSFDSAASELLTFDPANAARTDSMRFLGFAASHNLVHYVQQMVDCREKSVSPETLHYLLCCSISSYGSMPWYTWGPDLAGPLKVVLELLRRGANPNAKLFAKTIWREFLERTATLWADYFLDDRFGYSDVWNPNSQTLTSSIIAFIENGADMGATWTFHFVTSPQYRFHSFDMQLSPLSAIQLVLRHTPNFPRIQEMCIARGALLYSRCTILQGRFNDGTEEPLQSYYLRQYELSDRESEEFVAIFEQFAALRSTELEEDPTNIKRQLRDFSERLDVIHSDTSNSSRVLRTSITRTSWKGSEWYTHKSFFDPKTYWLDDWEGPTGHQKFYDAPSSPS